MAPIFFDEDDDDDREFLSEVRRRMGSALDDMRTASPGDELEVFRLHRAALCGDVVAIAVCLLLNGALTWRMLVGAQCGTT